MYGKLNEKEKEALNKIIDNVMKHIAWDETLGRHNQVPMLEELSEAKKVFNEETRDKQ
jgi:acyl-CoA hydrolase